MVVNDDYFGGEVDADCDLIFVFELSVDVLVDEGGLARACVVG